MYARLPLRNTGSDRLAYLVPDRPNSGLTWPTRQVNA